MTNICITGGNGFIGSHLARALPDAHLFDYPAHDLRNLVDANDFILEYQPEVVFHLAAQSVVTNEDDIETLATNIDGTYNLLHACKTSAKQLRSFVHISSDKVYGTNANARRMDPLRGVSHPYNVSKLCGDEIAQMFKNFYGLPVRIVRINCPPVTHTRPVAPARSPGSRRCRPRGPRRCRRQRGSEGQTSNPPGPWR